MTTANKITILRILLVPFFITEFLYYTESGSEVHRFLALLAFAVAAISDGIDGYIARQYNQHSELGAILDPLADKLLLVSGLILLSLDHSPHFDRIPIWLVVTVVSRDILLLIGLIVIQYICGKVIVRPHYIGKFATFLQMVAILWALLKWPSSWLLGWCLAAAAATGVSAVIYIYAGLKQLSASPASGPSHEQHR